MTPIVAHLHMHIVYPIHVIAAYVATTVTPALCAIAFTTSANAEDLDAPCSRYTIRLLCGASAPKLRGSRSFTMRPRPEQSRRYPATARRLKHTIPHLTNFHGCCATVRRHYPQMPQRCIPRLPSCRDDRSPQLSRAYCIWFAWKCSTSCC